MDKAETIREHRKMWNWIADETKKRKRRVEKTRYFVENGYPSRINNCFCCDYLVVNKIQDRNNSITCHPDCTLCPVKWPDNGTCCHNDGALYMQWIFCMDWKKSADLARRIADLPENNWPGLWP